MEEVKVNSAPIAMPMPMGGDPGMMGPGGPDMSAGFPGFIG